MKQSTSGKNDRTRPILDLFVPETVRGLLDTCGSNNTDLDAVYRHAVGCIVDALLSRYGNPCCTEPCRPAGVDCERLSARLTAEVGEVEPEEVGRLYEHLRAFRLNLDPAGRPLLDSHAGGRRSQGLFYTPEHIVRHIVSKSLDELEISSGLDLLDLRVLDPAVGGGLFLAEALEQMTERILRAAGDCRSHPPARLAGIRDDLAQRLKLHGKEAEPDIAAAVRAHVMVQCLYGVDLDPIAVHIARALLIKRSLDYLPIIPGVEPNVRQGNSLIGENGHGRPLMSIAEANSVHANAYAGKWLTDGQSADALCKNLCMIHWPLEYPEVFRGDKPGFDLIVGNPPYEIVSVKESGINERGREQSYFRKMYGTCSGKINTYRLMLERGLGLLREAGVLGFIVPATLLADSTASGVRRKILEESRVCHAVVIPEKARVFERVTQALLILVTQKGRPTRRLETVFWDGSGRIGDVKGVEVSMPFIEKTNMRIPLLRSDREKALLEVLLKHPPLGGDTTVGPVAAVHQGEINLTTHRRFITSERSRYPLIRGEHLQPFRVSHPSSRKGRLDWLFEQFIEDSEAGPTLNRADTLSLFPWHSSGRDRPWEQERIAVGRVVNMATATRLKAAYVAPGQFLGDMTNSVLVARDISVAYLLGLLNSRTLNWRIKLTSTNNYLSAAEIEALPIPRANPGGVTPAQLSESTGCLRAKLPCLNGTLAECAKVLEDLPAEKLPSGPSDVTAAVIAWAVDSLLSCDTREHACHDEVPQWRNLVEVLVLRLFGVEEYAGVVES